MAQAERLTKRDRTRAALVGATLNLLKTRVWSAITVQDIADAAGVVKATVFNVFKADSDELDVRGLGQPGGGRMALLRMSWENQCRSLNEHYAAQPAQPLDRLMRAVLKSLYGTRNLIVPVYELAMTSYGWRYRYEVEFLKLMTIIVTKGTSLPDDLAKIYAELLIGPVFEVVTQQEPEDDAEAEVDHMMAQLAQYPHYRALMEQADRE